jgi:Ca2+-binding EF-hand superfamily protein
MIIRLCLSVCRAAQNTTCPLQYLLKRLMREAEGESKAVCFSEFRNALRGIVSDTSLVSDEDLRLVFNAADTNADGRLSVDEFTKSMHVKAVTPPRKDIVRQAFFTIDRHEEKQITLSAFMDFFNVNFHPDVSRGLKTQWVVLADVEDYFLASSVSE